MTKKKEESNKPKPMRIPLVAWGLVYVPVTWMSPLIHNNFATRKQTGVLDKQTGEEEKEVKKDAIPAPRPPKDPRTEYVESLYWFDPIDMPEAPSDEDIKNATFGFPAVAFKKAVGDVAKRHIKDPNVTQVKINNAVYVLGEGPKDLVKLKGSPSVIQNVMRVGRSQAPDFRFRGIFEDVSAVLPIEYVKEIIDMENLVRLVSLAGELIGVGDSRPGKSAFGYGRFFVSGDIKEGRARRARKW